VLKKYVRFDESTEKYIGKEATEELRDIYSNSKILNFSTSYELAQEKTIDNILAKKKQNKNSCKM
jgi:hypothetical protein